jgi:hypothetical protein
MMFWSPRLRRAAQRYAGRLRTNAHSPLPSLLNPA